MGYYLLLVMYALLLLVYAAHYTEPTVRPWPRLNATAPEATVPATCRDHDACPEHYKCVSGHCYPQFLRGEACSEDTGRWRVVKQYDHHFAACECTYPHLFTHKYFGGDCTVAVACQPHGLYNAATGACDCAPGYKAVGLTCLRMSALERDGQYPCERDELVHATRVHGFHDDYASAHRDKTCFRAPCRFDAFSGLALKNAHYDPEVGCVCDPTLGQFGVRIRGSSVTPFTYLSTPGYNGCASIYRTPLETPVPVDMYSYFYIMDRPPIVFLQYPQADASQLIPSLRPLIATPPTGPLQIVQEFPYDYMQTFFRKRMWQQAKRLRKMSMPRMIFYTQQRIVHEKQTPYVEYCRYMVRSRHMSMVTKFARKHRVPDYNLLYNFPACYVAKDEVDAPVRYRGRYVLNPFHLTLRDDRAHARFNGLHVGFDGHQWHVDFAPAYKVETYLAAAAVQKDNVPRLTNPIVDLIDASDYYHITQKAYAALEEEYRSKRFHRYSLKEPEFFQ